jgi:hypothetical protein
MKNYSEKPKHVSISKLIAWSKTHRKASIILCAVFMIILGGGTSYLVLSNTHLKDAVKKIAKQAEKPAPKEYYSPLTGLKVATEALTTQIIQTE